MRHLYIIGCYTPWVTMWGIQCVEDTISMTKSKECHHQSCGFDLIKCSAEFWATYLWDKNEMSLELRDAVVENSCARYKTCYKSMSVLWNISRCSYVWKHWNPCGEVYWTLCSGQVGYVVRVRFMGCMFRFRVVGLIWTPIWLNLLSCNLFPFSIPTQ